MEHNYVEHRIAYRMNGKLSVATFRDVTVHAVRIDTRSAKVNRMPFAMCTQVLLGRDVADKCVNLTTTEMASSRICIKCSWGIGHAAPTK